ncbi:exodeoxyribonuclease VII small subunit [Paucibacter sp. DJ2R-2]|uniref:exodeoxyribonuclease VII small subunit n=1 Tax=Paucibacter sp. DJ2R-2 TaxID=2893558 RepID=UPI0021E4C28D|nr:exodeoxyribonuclease VII small subunit [Paucibacter sp. DJ2R-2]MCV2421446.1 exodeoxyribonuclease VII small subunit [Paucibacter sp. DJ4R-1]MCV2438128.1 exodeoxyribonuclease VII small subunit [Paucibacter sp. DJ2R-2]
MTRSSSASKAATKAASPQAAEDLAHLSYEQALGELEGLLADMEGGQLPLDQLLESYKRGAGLLGLCRSRLQAVEQQVKVLEGEGLKQWGES